MALFIPALDLVNAEVVRLYQGALENKKVYYKNIFDALDIFLKNNIQYLHIVDLDGAIVNKPQKDLVHTIAARLKGVCAFQWAGGIRDHAYLEYVLSQGAAKVVVSTQAFLDKPFVKKALGLFPGRIVVSFDFRDNRLCVKGWKEEVPSKNIPQLFQEFIQDGCSDFIITDISSDGTLQGARLDFFASLMQGVPASFCIAGGIGSDHDLAAIHTAAIPHLKGVIVGKALYEGRVNIQTAQKILNGDIIL